MYTLTKPAISTQKVHIRSFVACSCHSHVSRQLRIPHYRRSQPSHVRSRSCRACAHSTRFKRRRSAQKAQVASYSDNTQTRVRVTSYTQLTHNSHLLHSSDHAGGNSELAARYPHAMVVGPANEHVPACTKRVKGGQTFSIGSIDIKVLDVPCHTRGHVAYVVTGDHATPPLLFPGDVLFVGGCGRFFEGSAEDMYHALYEVILQLPKDTRCYCGHE